MRWKLRSVDVVVTLDILTRRTDAAGGPEVQAHGAQAGIGVVQSGYHLARYRHAEHGWSSGREVNGTSNRSGRRRHRDAARGHTHRHRSRGVRKVGAVVMMAVPAGAMAGDKLLMVGGGAKVMVNDGAATLPLLTTS